MVQSPEVELVEPEAVTVKEEKVEPNGSEEEKTEPDVQLIGDDGERRCNMALMFGPPI